MQYNRQTNTCVAGSSWDRGHLHIDPVFT